MKKIISYIRKIPVWLILLICTIPAFISIVRPGYYPMQDDLQAFRIQQMDKCFQDLQLPCRWVPDPGYQYGYPLFNYYPPSVYYLGETFHLIGFQFIDSVKIVVIISFLLSAIFMYMLLGSILGKWIGFVGALLYTYNPYRALDPYVRGDLSESFSFVFFPLIFWAIYKLIKTQKWRYVAWLAVAVSGLMLTHNLMTLIFFPLALVWTLTLLVLERKWGVLYKLIIGALLAAGLAAFFTIPVLTEQKYAHVESLVGGYFDYRLHFVDINELFLSNYWGFGSSVWGPFDQLSLSTGVVQWVIAAIGGLLLPMTFRKNLKIAALMIVLGLLEIFVLFMNHQKSSFIWSSLPFMAFLQFPWRLLADSVFLLAILDALCLYQISLLDFKWNSRKMVYAIGLGFALSGFIMTWSFFHPNGWYNITDKDKFSGALWQKELTISIFDYLPIYAKLPPIQDAPSRPEVLSGKVNFLSYKKGSDYQIGETQSNVPSLIRLPLFDFPGMKVTVDGKSVAYTHNDCVNEPFCLGLITFALQPGNHQIEAQLTNTPVRTIGNYTSLVSFILLGFVFWKGYNDKKAA